VFSPPNPTLQASDEPRPALVKFPDVHAVRTTGAADGDDCGRADERGATPNGEEQRDDRVTYIRRCSGPRFLRRDRRTATHVTTTLARRDDVRITADTTVHRATALTARKVEW